MVTSNNAPVVVVAQLGGQARINLTAALSRLAP